MQEAVCRGNQGRENKAKQTLRRSWPDLACQFDNHESDTALPDCNESQSDKEGGFADLLVKNMFRPLSTGCKIQHAITKGMLLGEEAVQCCLLGRVHSSSHVQLLDRRAIVRSSAH